jgi:hypothetical protein
MVRVRVCTEREMEGDREKDMCVYMRERERTNRGSSTGRWSPHRLWQRRKVLVDLFFHRAYKQCGAQRVWSSGL